MTNRSGAPPRGDAATVEQRRQASAQVVTACYRLVKACQLYDDANQSVREHVPIAVDAVATYCQLFECDVVRVLFSPEMVFVNRRIMRAPRETYAIALQLGAMLEQCGVTEIAVQHDAPAEAIQRFARIVADGQRDMQSAQLLQEEGALQGIAARYAELDDEMADEMAESPEARVVKGYAASILVLQSFYEDLSRGEIRGAHEVKRIAQKLVALGGQHPELLIAAATARFPDDDPARRAVSTAVIVIAMARQLTQDRVLLTSVALAALLAESGRWREGQAQAKPAPDAPSTLIAMTAIGKLYPTALQRSVVAFEALSMDGALAGVYGATTAPTVVASLLYLARRFNELRTPTAERGGLPIDQVVTALEQQASTPEEQPYLRLLEAALGLFPTGTVVELSTGEVAMVTGVPAFALDFARPPVRILSNAKRQVMKTPLDIDLAKPPPGQPPRTVRKPLSQDLGGAPVG